MQLTLHKKVERKANFWHFMRTSPSE